MKLKHLLPVLIAIAFCCCKKGSSIGDTETPPVTTPKADTAAITSLKIEAALNPSAKLTSDILCTVADTGLITAVLPARDASKKLIMTFTTRAAGTTVKINDTTIVSRTTVADYTKPVNYTITTPLGNVKTYKVLIKVFTGLPILYINTSAPVTSKDNYVKGSLTVDANLGFTQEQTKITLQMKGRGNSTWSEFPKKPYRLKFDSKTGMLGMPAAKNWVLLANYDDKTLMRNYLAFQLGKRLGADFTPDSRFVEVVLNGDFIGNYQLTYQVEVNPSRVNITEMSDKDTSPDAITGGYLLELDQRLDADFWFKTKKNIPLTVKSPDAITPAQLSYISNYIQSFEDALFSANFTDPVKGYAPYINSDSFINWYLVEEILQNQDGRDFSSMFYYKDRNGKLGMGPVWDFDISSGNIDYSIAKNPTGTWYIRDATWMIRLAQDPTFILKVRKRWADIKNKEVAQIFTDIDNMAAQLQLSQQQNFTRWPILDKYVWPNNVVLGTYDKEVAYMKNFITQRVAWIDANMAQW